MEQLFKLSNAPETDQPSSDFEPLIGQFAESQAVARMFRCDFAASVLACPLLTSARESFVPLNPSPNPEMNHIFNQALTSAQLLTSRVHPVLVHLPIGGLVLLGFLEVLARWNRWKNAAQGSLPIIVFVSASAIAAAASGWRLGHSGGYDPQLLKWHEAAGLTLAAICVVAAVLRKLDLTRAYRVCLAAAIPVLIVAGHLGGSITHGRDFLTRRISKPPPDQPLVDRPVFAAVVQPILQQRCVACHGPERHKAGLRLDNFEALLKGGQNGPVLKAGHAEKSALLQRILLPLDEDGHMPPEDEPQMTKQEAALLKWWINAGAPTNTTMAVLKSGAKIPDLLEFESKRAE